MKSITLLVISTLMMCFQAQTANIILDKPQKLTASKDHPNDIYVKWEAVKGAKTYHVYRGTKKDRRVLSWIKTVAVAQLRDDRGLRAKEHYYYRVQALASDSSKSPFSDFAEGQILEVAAPNEKEGDSDCTPLSIKLVDSLISLKNDRFDVDIDIENKCRHAVDSPKLCIFLASDTLLDEKKGIELFNKTLETMTVDGSYRARYPIPLPEKTPIGRYYLLIKWCDKVKQMSIVVGE